jgi:hypothetical protein
VPAQPATATHVCFTTPVKSALRSPARLLSPSSPSKRKADIAVAAGNKHGRLAGRQAAGCKIQPEEGSGSSGSISKAAQRVLCSPTMLSSIGAPACRSPAGARVKPQADGAAEAPKRQGDESVGGV